MLTPNPSKKEIILEIMKNIENYLNILKINEDFIFCCLLQNFAFHLTDSLK